MKISPSRSLAATLAALVSTPALQAHIGFGGDRNFDTLTIGVTETSGSRTVSGSFGWADGADADYGDSHRNTYFRFVVTDPISVTISVSRLFVSGQTGADGVLLPAFSLYRIGTGSMPSSTHDASPNTVAYLQATFGADAGTGIGGSGKEGAFNALGDWVIYNDAGAFGDFRHIGHAADGTSDNYGLASGITGDGLADGFVTRTFADLAAGEYFIVVGGAGYDAQNTETATHGTLGNAYPTYGISVSVTAIPEPSAFAALVGVGALGLVVSRRRRAR
jgi:hypothetical protein